MNTYIVVSVADYHDISYISHCIVGNSFKSIEVGMSDGDYIGIIYKGKKPTKEKIKQLLHKNGIILNDY